MVSSELNSLDRQIPMSRLDDASPDAPLYIGLAPPRETAGHQDDDKVVERGHQI